MVSAVQPFLLFAVMGGSASFIVGILNRPRLSGPLTPTRLGQLIVTAMAFVVLFAGIWLVCDQVHGEPVLGILTNEPFSWRRPLSARLEELKSPVPNTRFAAVLAMKEFGPEDPRVLPALRGAVLDSDVQVASTAARVIHDRFPKIDRETVIALGKVIRRNDDHLQRECFQALHRGSASQLEPIIPDLCRVILSYRQCEVFELLHAYSSRLDLPNSGLYCRPPIALSVGELNWRDHKTLENDARMIAAAVRQLGPEAMAEYHAAILELLQRGTNRRIGAIALAGLGSANPDEVCALTKIANEQDKYEFLNLIAAHALARIGQEDRAAETLVAILGRNNFTNFINELDELDPWEELISLSAEVRARLPQEVFDLCTSDSIKERLRAK